MDRENAAGNFRCSALSEDSHPAIALALHLNYASHSGMLASNISAQKNLLLRIRDCLVSSASSSHGSYSDIRRPSNQTAMVALRDISIYVQVGGEVERGGEREGWEEGGKEGGATTHARPAFSALYHLSSSSSPSVRLALTSQFDGR